jgi:DNA polymerase V
MAVRTAGKPTGDAVPCMHDHVHAGFPSPAADHTDDALSLDQRFIRNRLSTFIVRTAGASLRDIGIFADDYLVVDRSRTPHHGDVVIAIVDGGFVAKRFSQHQGLIQLMSANPNYPPIPWQEGCEIWGIVTSVHRDLLSSHAMLCTD